MKVYALWHGGSSYSPPYASDDVEVFDSILAAKEQFLHRCYGGVGRFQYVHKDDVAFDYTPAVGQDATMALYFEEPPDANNDYPDRLIEFGPRGGVVVNKV